MASWRSRSRALCARIGELSPADADALATVSARRSSCSTRGEAARRRDRRETGRGRRPRVAEAGDPAAVPPDRDLDVRARALRVRRQAPVEARLRRARVRVVPGASARRGSFLDRGVVLMPSYVNIGARVGADTMVDTWATVGSCAQIGERVHLSGGVGIGGVLEPPNAVPVVVEDDVLIGSRCMVTQGARVGQRRGARRGHASSTRRSRSSTPRRARSWPRGTSRPGASPSARRGAARVPRRRVLPAVRARPPPTSTRGRAPRQGALNEILREHGVSA